MKNKHIKNPVCKILKFGFSDIYKMVAYTRPIFKGGTTYDNEYWQKS